MNVDRAQLAGVWARLGGEAGLVERVTVGGPVPLPSALPLGVVAGAAVAAAALAGAEYRFPSGVPDLVIDPAAVATAFGSERHLRLDGERVVGFAPLSRFWPAADGWVRTHANYPHHRERLLSALGTDADGVGAAVAARSAVEVEEAVCEGGGLAFAVRGEAEWAAHPQGVAVAREPLVELEELEGMPGAGTGAARPVEPAGDPGRSLRVLDLTRTIAGPVAGRTLAFLGADVLRVDSPRLAEIPEQHLDTGWGKRSTLLDLASRRERAVFEGLLAEADVVLIGYRPGALDRFGLSPEELAGRHPGLVVGTLAAWGRTGPWAGRRGFDSLVQAASGIALLSRVGEDGRPGALPVQALDHATGYLLAAAVLRGLVRRRAGGGSQHASVTLAGTAGWLLGLQRSTGEAAPPLGSAPLDPAPYLAEADTAAGRLRYALPPFRLPGGPETWVEPVHPWGSDRPAWR